MCCNNPSSWSFQLPWAEYSINCQVSASSRMFPFECCLGYKPPLFLSQEEEVGVPSVMAFVKRYRRMWRVTRANLIKATHLMKLQADRKCTPAPVYRVGQRVWLSTKDIMIRGSTKKLAPRFIGPFTILSIISPMAVRLRLPTTMRRVHPTFHVSWIKPTVAHALCPTLALPPTPRIIDRGETFTVRELMDWRRCGRGLQYLVNWEGYGPEERSWTPARFILDKGLIDDYHKTHPVPPVKTPRGAL